MRRIVGLTIFLLLVASLADAATWYVRPSLDADGASLSYGAADGTTYSTAWAGCANVVWGSVSPGDTIELDEAAIFYERCEIADSGSSGSPITIRGRNGAQAVFDYTVNVAGEQSFETGPVYVTTGYPWSLVAGTTEVYSKTTTDYPYLMMEDDIPLTPLDCDTDSEAQVLSNLERGYFCTRATGKTLYVRTRNGAAPGTHTLRVNNRVGDAIGTPGAIYLTGRSFITLSGITCRNYFTNKATTTDNACLVIRNSSDITLTGTHSYTYSYSGIALDGGSRIQLATTVSASDNIGQGIIAEGSTAALVDCIIRGQFNRNGQTPRYNGVSISHSQDSDGIGIGHRGGTITNLIIERFESKFNGPTSKSVTNSIGSGVYVGTVSALDASVTIRSGWVENNHKHGIYLETDDWIGGDVIGNVIKDNCATAISSIYALQLPTNTAVTVPVRVMNNTFHGNSCKASIFYRNNNGVVATIINNIFYNNGSDTNGNKANADDYRGDIWIENALATTAINEDANVYWRSGTNGFDSAVAINTTGTDYLQTQLLGGAGTWQGDTTNGDNNKNVNPLFLSAGNDYRLSVLSTVRRAGVMAPACQDYRGRPCWPVPDIGAYQATSGDRATTRTAR